MRTAHKPQKRGFTLVETVVTVGIIAALAAVVYPTVVRQFDSADPTRVVEDLNSLRTGIEAFGVNVRPHQPGDVEDLVNKILNASDANAQGTAFVDATDQPKWVGPYIGASVPATAAATDVAITTGFGALIQNGFVPLKTTGTLTNNGGDVVGSAPFTTADFLAVKVTGLSLTAFNDVNTLLDGPTEDADNERQSLGRWTCPYAAAGSPNSGTCPVAYFLAAPFRH
jgi:prepilin-type N-terminal cleavage/methylation domain-containing protein